MHFFGAFQHPHRGWYGVGAGTDDAGDDDLLIREQADQFPHISRRLRTKQVGHQVKVKVGHGPLRRVLLQLFQSDVTSEIDGRYPIFF